ncbi:hypothetical protein F4779DRAFT_561421 [Xylariaceae sp. FL0662B]|nr:hypothetical protein F4779DRAFT_561421 [Xylariaceae sp. FL0662B]
MVIYGSSSSAFVLSFKTVHIVARRRLKYTSLVSQVSHYHRGISYVGNSFVISKTISCLRIRGIKSSSISATRKQPFRTITMASSKLIPSNPADVAVIRNITPNVVTVSAPFARFGLIRIGGRGTIIRLTSGTLAVFSPVALTAQTKAKVDDMGGNVGYLIAGDIEHHIFLSEWAAAYPSAKLIAPKGLPEKRAKTKGDDKVGQEPFAFVFDGGSENKRDAAGVGADFAADCEVEFVDAHPNRELVLFYRPDRVLVQADLMFNLPALEQYSRVPESERRAHGMLNRLFETLNSTAGEAKGIKRFLWYAISSSDRAGFNESIRRIDSWDFATIIPCHGETIEGNGKEVFRKVFEWHLQGHK